MRWPRRSAAPHPLPDDVRARLRLDRHERVLAAAALEDGGWLVTSSTALLLADAGPDARQGTGPDAGQAARPEAGQHFGPDARQDVGPDARQDVGPDPGPDPGQRTGSHAGRDAGPDPRPDARENGPGAGQNAGQHQGPEPGPDPGPNPGTDQGQGTGSDAGRDADQGTGPDPGQGAGPPDRPVVRHLWHEVAEATWDPEERVLVVRWATPGEPAVRLRLAEPLGAVPEVVRERVMSTYVLSQRVSVRGRRGVTVAVRRHAVDGSLLVQTVPDAGINLSRPETAERVAALARELAQQVGLHG